MSLKLPKIEDFAIVADYGGDVYLLCPHLDCPAREVAAPDSFGEAQDAIEGHIRAHHLPRLADGWRYCPTCHNAIYGRAVRCLECAQ